MPGSMTNKELLKAYGLQYLGGDDEWYSASGASRPSYITVSGPLASILNFARLAHLRIVPDGYNMTKYDGCGIATVTLFTGSSEGGGGGQVST